MKHFNSKSWFFAVLAIMTLASACHRETIYLENDGKQIRDKQNKFIGTWVRCGRALLTDSECTCDTSYTGPIDTLVFTADSVTTSYEYTSIKTYPYEFSTNYLSLFVSVSIFDTFHVQRPAIMKYLFSNNNSELVIDNSIYTTTLIFSAAESKKYKMCFKKVE